MIMIYQGTSIRPPPPLIAIKNLPCFLMPVQLPHTILSVYFPHTDKYRDTINRLKGDTQLIN